MKTQEDEESVQRTDLGIVTEDIMELLSGADVIVIEANHYE